MGEFFNVLHEKRQFASLTGPGGDLLKTFWTTMEEKKDVFNGHAPAYAVDVYASPTQTSKWVSRFFKFNVFKKMNEVLSSVISGESLATTDDHYGHFILPSLHNFNIKCKLK